MTYTNNQKACLLLRLFLGMMFLFASFGKFKMGLNAFADMIAKGFTDTMLPHFFLVAYGYVLPIVELVLGITLLLGIFADVMTMVAALTLLSLFFGKFITGDGAVAAYYALYFFVAVYAVRCFEHVALSVDVMTRKRKLATPSS
ncbi:MAG: DoxX family membrane protein [Verrucomicrobiae bacterium]|nr:DoxX family membrane protein [Verrucomicrobiae bacterium]